MDIFNAALAARWSSVETAVKADNVKPRRTDQMAKKKKPGLYANINAKRKRIAAGSGEKMRKAGSKGAPSAADFRAAAKTAKKRPTKKTGRKR